MTYPEPTQSAPHALGVETYMVVDFAEELKLLPDTYAAAMEVDVSAMAAWLRQHDTTPLITVGAGGSLAVAEVIARLHETATGQLSVSRQPMDLYLMGDNATDAAMMLVTASGGHSDSLVACELLPSLPLPAAVFCGKQGSAGQQILDGTAVDVFPFDLLPDVHGWVAVNVLLAQTVVAIRAYSEAFGDSIGTLPVLLDDLLPEPGIDATLAWYQDVASDALSKDALVFLHGPMTRAAAIDLDSKFSESGLGELQLSEYRNFAHGRYQMTLPRTSEVGVIGVYTSLEEPIASQSLDALPHALAHAGIRIPGSSPAAQQLGCILSVLFLTRTLENARSIPVGWGSRNTYGDVLYDVDLLPIVRATRPTR